MEHLESLVQAANQHALARMFAAHPVWTRIVSAAEALTLDDHTILHAGPPLADPCNPPGAIRSSMVLSCMYEGWATDEDQAEALIQSGQLKLLPAQDHGCVTPLAAVITPSSTLVEVADAAGVLPPVWSLLASGPAPDLRFGSRDLGCLSSMVYRDGELKSLLLQALDTPIDLVALANLALAQGDELHSRTLAATAALHQALLPRLLAAQVDHGALDKFSAMMTASPGFFLTLWMAACRLYLSACDGVAHCSLVNRMGANGETVGFSLGREPGKWITATATPPVGARFPHQDANIIPSGVVGDSAVVDAMGFGGQLVSNSPDVLASLVNYLPVNYEQTSLNILSAVHPAYDTAQVRCGLDVRRVHQSGITPLVNIGMLAADGVHGLLGRGLYTAPLALFAGALEKG